MLRREFLWLWFAAIAQPAMADMLMNGMGGKPPAGGGGGNFIDDNGVTSWIDDNSVTSWTDDLGH